MKLSHCAVGVVFLSLFALGCQPNDPRYQDAAREEALYVVPAASLSSLLEGTRDGTFSPASDDAYADGAYVIRDANNVSLRAYNSASDAQNRLELSGENPSVAYNVNDIKSLSVVVTVRDASKLSMVFVNGQLLEPKDFTYGVPELIDGELLDSGARLPGYYAVVKTGPLNAKESAGIEISAMGKYELALHVDAFGEVWGHRVLVTGPASGTSLIFSPAPYHLLTVSKQGNGEGLVDSTPAGISCGEACAAQYVEGSRVVLTATPQAGSAFAGWSGDCSGSQPTCTVALDRAKDVEATFRLTRHTVSVAKTGDGAGAVSSVPAGIDCGASCEATYDYGTSVTLTAAPSASSDFSGWSGACAGTEPTCAITVAQAASATAEFTLKSYPLAVSVSGSGSVASSAPGIACGADCSETLKHGTSVTLLATPSTGAVFAGWSGACTGLSPSCTVSMTEARAVHASFGVASYTLAVTKSGTGAGSVASSPAGIDCGDTCSAAFNHGQSVTLLATPNAGSLFAGWSGACAGSGASCTVSLTSALSTEAVFNPEPPKPPLPKYELTVTKDGAAGGTIASSPAGIDCGQTCSALFEQGTSVTLLATPDNGAVFMGWSGACTGAEPTCTVTMAQAAGVSATFAVATYSLTITKTGGATGTVTSSPAGIDCGSQCSGAFGYGTTVTLIATPSDASAEFTGWSGACSGTSPTCVVTVDGAKNVTANFETKNCDLVVEKTGTGTGTITSNDGGISCGGDCSQTYPYGATVTLTASPDSAANPFTVFTGWTGACSGTELTCTVTVDDVNDVGANFDIITEITIALNASKIYQDGVANWGVYAIPQRANLAIPAQITLSAGNTGNHVAAVDFAGTVCCYKGSSTADGRVYAFRKCIDGSAFQGDPIDSLGIFDACKDNSTPVLAGLGVGSTIQMTRGSKITLLVENDDNRNPPEGSPNYQAIVQVVISVLGWFQP